MLSSVFQPKSCKEGKSITFLTFDSHGQKKAPLIRVGLLIKYIIAMLSLHHASIF